MSHNRDKTVNQGNSSFWRRHGSSEDQQSATSGNQDRAQPNPSSAFRSGWGRPDSSNPQASGGGGLRRQPSFFDRPAAVGGGLGRPNGDSNPQASYGGRWGSRHTPIETSSQPPQRPTRREQLIRDLCKHGIGALQPHLQKKFMTYKFMHNSCFLVEKLDNAMLVLLQTSLCTTERGVLLGVIAIQKDHSAENPDGLKLCMFKQSMKYGGKYINRDANDITIVCVICHGSRKFMMAQGDVFKVPKGSEFGSTALYGSGGQAYVQKSVEEGSHMKSLKDNQSANVFVPDSEDSFAYKSSEHDPAVEAFCVKIMEDQGCVHLPPFSAPIATEMHASSAEVAGEAPVEALMISCYHGNCVKSFDGKYESCQDCLRDRGKMTIVDGWGEVVGYHKPL